MYKIIAEGLIKIFNDNAYLSIIIEENLKYIDDKDKALFTKIMYGVVEKKIYLDYLLQPYTKGKRVKPFIRNCLRMGLYMINELSMPNHFVVDIIVDTVKQEDYNASKFVNGILRNYLRSDKREVSKEDIKQYISITCSIPLELVNYLYDDYKEDLYNFYIKPSTINHYRINLLKTNVNEIKDKLDKLNIKYNIKDNHLETNVSLIGLDIFKEGLIISIDSSSMKVIDELPSYDFNEVLDVASAPGGKACYLAEKMDNKGHITCCDIYPNKLDKIKENVSKLGISNIDVMIADGTNYNYPKQYDLILCDLPCSGLGTINHKPDLKYHIKLDDIKDIIKLQKEILNHIKDYVKEDGLLLYSTCTINKDENERQIKAFLKENKEFTLMKELTILPSEFEDGFYISLMKKG